TRPQTSAQLIRATRCCRGLRDPRSRPRGQVALQICPPEWHSRLADFHGRRGGPARHEQWRPNRRLGGAPIGSLTPRLVQEARSAIAWLYRFFAANGLAQTSLTKETGNERKQPRRSCSDPRSLHALLLR